mgnify:CR=1 FL=1
MTAIAKEAKIDIDGLLKSGVHFGFGRSRRHPSVKDYIFGSKNKTDIFDLEKTSVSLKNALDFLSKLGEENQTLLLVGGKNEAREAVKAAGEKMKLPYVAGRWIGGTLTNFPEVRKRIDRMLDLMAQKKSGELAKYTKKERLLLDREIAKLQNYFAGLTPMTALPKAVFVVDARFEATAVREARKLHIPVVALCSSDNNVRDIDYPILGNDASRSSVSHIIELVEKADLRN